MKAKIIIGTIIVLLLASVVLPVIGETASIGSAGEKQQPSIMRRGVNLTLAITTDWVGGWQNHGPLLTEFPLSATVWAYSELAGGDMYGSYLNQVWWYDNGAGLQNIYSSGWQVTTHWTSTCTWSSLQVGLQYGKGQGFVETLIDNVSLGISNWYTVGNITTPSTPTITGNTSGPINKPQTYTFNATDPNGFNLSYYVDWGDTTNSGWIGPYPSGDEITQSHTWTKKGTYTIKAKAKDIHGNESGWGTLSVTMPTSYNIPFQPFWMKIFERFPHAFPILRHLMGY